MPLACLTAVAGGVSVGPGVRCGCVVSPVDSTLGQSARSFRLCAARRMGIATADTAEASAGLLPIAPRRRWLAVVESGGGWQAVQLRPDSLALPLIVVLRFRLRGSSECARSAYRETRRQRMCTDACEFGSNSAGVGGRHQNSVERLGQQVRIVECVMQAATFLALHG